jgi:hypothetical protein
MWPRSRPLALGLGVLAPGCQFPQGQDSSFTTNVMLSAGSSDGSAGNTSSSSGGAGSSGGMSAGESTAGSGQSEDSSGGPGTVLDVGAEHDAGDGKPPGCAGKIDFLFVISRYGTMQPYQEKLVAAFPKFIETIETKFADFDYHIMVVDGDATWGYVTCEDLCPAACAVPDYLCDYTPSTCDELMGTGTLAPAGGGASNRVCPIAGGKRYMSTGQPDLAETFSCVARVGMSGGKYIAAALTASVQHNLNGPGGCNGGFLRDDALLMVTMISSSYDEPNSPTGSPGAPETWRAELLATKAEDPSSIVMFSIMDAAYAPGCHPKDRMCQLVRTFPYSLITDVEGDTYDTSFAAAAELVDGACEGFVPPG